MESSMAFKWHTNFEEQRGWKLSSGKNSNFFKLQASKLSIPRTMKYWKFYI